MKNRLSIKLCQKYFLTEKKYDELGKYSSIPYVQGIQDASSLTCAHYWGNKKYVATGDWKNALFTKHFSFGKNFK